MRIALEASPLALPRSGIGVYVEEAARALAQRDEIRELLLLAPTAPPAALLANPRVRWIAPPRRLPRSLWLQFEVPRAVARENPDLTHYPNFVAPLGARHPYVVTIHDLVLLRHPETTSLRKRLFTRSVLPSIARRARGVLTVSEAAKREIVDLLELPEDRVVVVPFAPPPAFERPVSPSEIEATRRRLGLTRPYLLAVGNLEPRKNLGMLFAAFDQLRSQHGIEHQLVVVGAGAWGFGPTQRALDRLASRDSIQILRNAPPDDLRALFAGASLFAFPSIYEGFGLPPVEAMWSGAPVVASEIPSVREVTAGAALLVDPYSVEAWVTALKRVLDDASLADDLRRRGFDRARNFTWERSARGLVEAYDRFLGQDDARSLRSVRAVRAVRAPHRETPADSNVSNDSNDSLVSAHRDELRAIASLPFVRLAALRGDERSDERSDQLNLFIITARGRAYLVFTAIELFSRLSRGRRVVRATRLVDERALASTARGRLLASELVQLRPLEPSPELFALFDRNPWIREHFPEASPRPPLRLGSRGPIARVAGRALEWWLTPLAALLEPIAREYWIPRLAAGNQDGHETLIDDARTDDARNRAASVPPAVGRGSSGDGAPPRVP